MIEPQDDYLIHAPVGSLLPSAFGLHDMGGNVWEWCADQGASHETAAIGARGLRIQPNAPADS